MHMTKTKLKIKANLHPPYVDKKQEVKQKNNKIVQPAEKKQKTSFHNPTKLQELTGHKFNLLNITQLSNLADTIIYNQSLYKNKSINH